MQLSRRQSPPTLDLSSHTTPLTSPFFDANTLPEDYSPASSPPLPITPPLLQFSKNPTSVSVTTSNTTATIASTQRRLSVPGARDLVDKIRSRLLTRRQVPEDQATGEQEGTQFSVGYRHRLSSDGSRYLVNDKDVRSIIEFVLLQSRERRPSNASTRLVSADSQCRLHSPCLPPPPPPPPLQPRSLPTMDNLPSPASTSSSFSSSYSPDNEDVLGRLRALAATPATGDASIPSVVKSPPEPTPRYFDQAEVEEPDEAEVATDVVLGTTTDPDVPTTAISPPGRDIWSLCLARPSRATPGSGSRRTKPAPSMLKTSPARATTTVQTVQDHAVRIKCPDRRRSIVSRSDLSVYSHGGAGSTDGLTSFPKLRRRRSSEWYTPAELMDRQNSRPDAEDAM